MPRVVLSPALPSELLTHVLAHCGHPTTLVVCASSDDFVRACVEEEDDDDNHHNHHRYATVSLLQTAVARHIRVAFVPTVAHLRAFLTAFAPAGGPVPPPPVSSSSSSSAQPRLHPALLVYGFVALHHDTSEWSAQGLGASAAVLVEAAWRAGWHAILVEGRRGRRTATQDDALLLQTTLPVLSAGPRRQLQQAGYPLRTRSVRSVLGRWFRFRPGPWEEELVGEGIVAKETETTETVPGPGPPARAAARNYIKDSEDEDDDDDDDDNDENEPT